MIYLLLFAGLFMGWSLGTNDAANAFGTAVATRVIRYRTAVIIIAVMVVVGAILLGDGNINKVSELATSNKVTASLEEVESAVAGWAADWRLCLHITLAAYATGHHTHRLVLAVVELCAAVATLDNISDSHSCKVLSCYSPHFVSAPVMYNITLAVIAKSIKIRNISVSF